MPIVILSIFLLSGCAAQMVSQPGQISQYAPSNESSRVGTIKYLNQGAASVIRSRREDAYKQMYAACNSKYKIVSEGPRAEGGTAMPMGSTVMYSSSEYWYISFQCE